MTCTGSRVSRAKQALGNIGPAVLNGGFSTFLAIILLANSESHAFKSFFKVSQPAHLNHKFSNGTRLIIFFKSLIRSSL